MIETRNLLPGVTLMACRDTRFKQGCLSFQLVQPMDGRYSAANALLPAVLLRGTKPHPDLRTITAHLDTLYGASVSTLVRRVGDCQTVGLYCGFMDDRFALTGDRVLAPMIRFLEELLLEPLTEGASFLPEIVESEKKNLISAIESERNDKRAYAMSRLLKGMCAGDSFGLPRLGEPEQVAAIDAAGLYAHYRKILSQSPIHIFYVGNSDISTVADLLLPMLEKLGSRDGRIPEQTPFRGAAPCRNVETMDVTQGKLCLGFTTPITNRSGDFAAMQVFNTVFGAGMTSKLFMNLREKMGLCYQIGSGYYSTKGILTVSAGIDFDTEEQTRQEILYQLEQCCQGNISPEELRAAKESLISSLRATHDSPGSIEGYYATSALSGLGMTPAQYRQALEQVQLSQVAAAAATVIPHSSYFLRGVNQ